MKVICAFPGTGKSYCHKQYPYKTVDSDSSNFSWEEPGIRHKEWPSNYIDHLKKMIEEYPNKVFFISTHAEVIKGLEEANIPYSIVKPKNEDKDVYMERYRQRGSDEKFLKLMDANFENFNNQLNTYNPENIYELHENETIFRIFNRITNE